MVGVWDPGVWRYEVFVLQSNEAPKGRMRSVPANQRGNTTQKSNQLASPASVTETITPIINISISATSLLVPPAPLVATASRSCSPSPPPPSTRPQPAGCYATCHLPSGKK